MIIGFSRKLPSSASRHVFTQKVVGSFTAPIGKFSITSPSRACRTPPNSLIVPEAVRVRPSYFSSSF
jgi:hypothetical protein